MTDPQKEGCAVHIRRLDDLEKLADKRDEKSHKLSSVVTGLKMQTDLLELDHEHLKRDFWKGMKDARIRAERTADGAADMLSAQGAQLLSFEKLSNKSESTERVLKWVLAVVTSVGIGTAIIVLSRAIQSGQL
jgi:Skp family chaperone for outer membrane proteins